MIVVLLILLQYVEALKPATLLKGAWDLFGRVPNDDFLFRTSTLVNPQLLTRSFTETVRQH